MEIAKFDVFTEIFTVSASLLLSQKIAAALTRKRAKGRDFYDIVFLLSFTKPNYEFLTQKFGISTAKILRARFVELSTHLDFVRLAKDVEQFLFYSNDRKKVELFPRFINHVEL